MKIVVCFTAMQEAKALPIILRHSPGMILKNRTYVLSDTVVQKLRAAKIKFTEITREAPTDGVHAGERI
jgi:ABC-type hemin transport system substrate-binding protein